MSGISAQKMNELFVSKLASPEEKSAAEEATGAFIRDRLRETSFADKVLPPDPVTPSDCQVSINHDTLVKIVWVEPESRAMALTFRGRPTQSYIRGPRAECAFFTISSEVYQKTEQELLVYPYPITKYIEDNVVKDLGEIKDREFMLHVEAAVQAMQKEANGGTASPLNASSLQGPSPTVERAVIKGELARVASMNNGDALPPQRNDLVRLKKTVVGKRLRAKVLLFEETAFTDMLQWTLEDVGDKIQGETTVEGYKYNTLLGCRFIRSIKTDILRPGNIYAFPEPNFLGRSYILNKPKYYIDKIANLITMQSWMDVGMVFVNIAGIAKLETYSGDANPETDADNIVSSVVPVDEDLLGAPNNRLDDGVKFPDVVT